MHVFGYQESMDQGYLRHLMYILMFPEDLLEPTILIRALEIIQHTPLSQLSLEGPTTIHHHIIIIPKKFPLVVCHIAIEHGHLW